ncbi:hypothetical protein IWQ62_004796 [Dispira parvispora]|uniref:Fungal-type protein kinase domain-containing protein n=1 Tax=Dispira parvispora TaxID=1520584 RepID=A0A9W8AKY5_9FUNG|nr:hypothetical protein IWQ62_004796 [Dispira parvispora]
MPATKHSDGEKKPEESPQKTQNDVTQGPFWRCFGVVAYKAECPKDHSKDDYGQLGWYFHSALQAVFERNTLWGWVVSESAVRFVFFTHSTGVSSEVIDMKGEAGRKNFMDNFIRLCLCSAYRAGFDPTKRWLEDDKKWEVKCFNSANPEKGESLLAYVNPLPFKISNSFYGRRTRCHLGSLTKDAETYDLILKESWVELDQDPDKPKTMNTESLPNEVRIFQEINKHKGENTNKFIAKGVPTMKAGGSVYINGDISSGSGCFSTVANYCGELDIIHREYDMQRYILPKTESSSDFVYFRSYPTTESSADIAMPKFKVVNRVHQRLLMSPIGEPMSALHTWHRSPKYPKEFEQMDRSDQRGYNVLLLFTKLFWIIYYLWKDCNIYHRDLSEGNVLVCENNGYPFPLLIDFDHSRLCSDVGNDSEQLLMGTVPFMSILNLAGYSHKLSIVDELESFLYLWLWKCTTGFTPSGSTSTRTTSISSHPRVQPVTRLKLTNQSRPALAGRRRPRGVAKEPEVWKWAQGNPRGYSLNWKMGHTTNDMLYSFVTRELRPEFRTFEPMFYRFRRVLFDWDGQQQLFNSGKLTRKRETKPQDDSSTGNNGKVDMSKIRDATPVQCHQTENSTTSDDSFTIDAYYERLISRAEEADDILGRFAYVIKHPFAR